MADARTRDLETESTTPTKASADSANSEKKLPSGVLIASVPLHVCSRGHSALEMLLEAYVYAHDVHHKLWDFALEIDILRKGGLANSDLRWLLCKGLLEHAVEIRGGDGKHRCFQAGQNLSFDNSSCFVLTDFGLNFIRHSLHGLPLVAKEWSSFTPAIVPSMDGNSTQLKPFWDRDRQELRVGNQVVKEFKVPAPNQEMVLAAFHEEDWPVRIDDPLPPRPELEPKRRLHDTINSLNRHQKSELIRFMGDGSGQGVRWEFFSRKPKSVVS